LPADLLLARHNGSRVYSCLRRKRQRLSAARSLLEEDVIAQTALVFFRNTGCARSSRSTLDRDLDGSSLRKAATTSISVVPERADIQVVRRVSRQR